MTTINRLWGSHRGRDNQVWNAGVASRNNQAGTNWQRSFRATCNRLRDRALQSRPKVVQIVLIDAPIHKTIAVSRRHERMLRHFQDITVQNSDFGEWLKCLSPAAYHIRHLIDEHKV